MYGAILGDIIGSPYEFDVNNIKTKNFPLFSERSEYTDDSIMTCAVAEALLACEKDADDETIKASIEEINKARERRANQPRHPRVHTRGYIPRYRPIPMQDGQ